MSEAVLRHELGFFGNIWVRQNVISKSGDFVPGHKHEFDHVSLLTTGSVEVEVDGYQAKKFVAPTFIVIKKDHMHKFTALEDNTVWYCVFAFCCTCRSDSFVDRARGCLCDLLPARTGDTGGWRPLYAHSAL